MIDNVRKILVITIIITAIIPNLASAAWWNPSTWKIFNRGGISSQQEYTRPLSTSSSTQEISSKNQPSTTSIKKTSNTRGATSSKKVDKEKTIDENMSPEDQRHIIELVKGFIIAIQNKDITVINNDISNQTKQYFDNILNLARTSQKNDLIKKDFSTIFYVVTTRILAASSTIDINSTDLISKAVISIPNSAFKSFDINSLQFSFDNTNSNSTDIIIKRSNETLVKYNIIKENNTWKIDCISILNSRNDEIEKELKKSAIETGKTREVMLESFISMFIGASNIETKYMIWTPLKERGDLKIENISLGPSLSDFQNKFSILYPNNWEIDSVDTTTLILSPYSSDGLRMTIAITPNRNPASTQLDVYIQELINKIKRTKTDLSGSIEQKQILFQGVPAYELDYKRLRTFNEGRTYITQLSRAYVFFKNNIVYLVEYRNGLANFEKDKAMADTIINTLKFENMCDTNNYCRSRQK